MPYITGTRRYELSHGGSPDKAGELNYEITKLVAQYVETKGLNYQTCNDIVGVLDNAKHEFQRRIQDPYENQAMRRNGDLRAYEKISRELSVII